MGSDQFNPTDEISFEGVKDVFVNPSKQEFKTYTNDSPDELKPISVKNK